MFDNMDQSMVTNVNDKNTGLIYDEDEDEEELKRIDAELA